VELQVVRTRHPVDLGLTLGPLQHGGRRDPCVRVEPRSVWRASDTRDGPATVWLRSLDSRTIEARAWGPGAGVALEGVADLVGADDDLLPLDGVHPLVTALATRLAGLRIGRTSAVMEALVPTVLAQRVIGVEARAAYVAMVRAAGRTAPGPAPHDVIDGQLKPPALFLPPVPRWLVSIPSWTFHRWGVERRRATTIQIAASYAHRFTDPAQVGLGEIRRRLSALPGVGPWTMNSVAMLALGDPDAVSVGDYWLKHVVTYALTGEPRGTDERMLELLEPWRGQRGRVCRLLMRGAPPLPRFGPRLPLRKLAAH
jgi:3-methyladenine DNA glycosylase/8-oxoguanine DNA glycosylase